MDDKIIKKKKQHNYRNIFLKDFSFTYLSTHLPPPQKVKWTPSLNMVVDQVTRFRKIIKKCLILVPHCVLKNTGKKVFCYPYPHPQFFFFVHFFIFYLFFSHCLSDNWLSSSKNDIDNPANNTHNGRLTEYCSPTLGGL